MNLLDSSLRISLDSYRVRSMRGVWSNALLLKNVGPHVFLRKRRNQVPENGKTLCSTPRVSNTFHRQASFVESIVRSCRTKSADRELLRILASRRFIRNCQNFRRTRFILVSAFDGGPAATSLVGWVCDRQRLRVCGPRLRIRANP